MKIGILYICIGKYDFFWKDFYLSSERYLFKNHEKHYFVFTDSRDIFDAGKNKNIHVIYQENLGWPDNALMRYHIFLKERGRIEKMDFVFFFNANTEIVAEIDDDVLPFDEGITVAQHPRFFYLKNTHFTYERRSASKAYIPKGSGKIYVQSAFLGGKTDIFLNMCKILADNTDTDKKKNIVTEWFDESYLNHYILSHPYKLVHPGYLSPEGWILPFPKKILLKNKSMYIHIVGVRGHWYTLRRFIQSIPLKLFILFNPYSIPKTEKIQHVIKSLLVYLDNLFLAHKGCDEGKK